MNETPICPRCKGPLPEVPALSRLDNKTPICSACGRREGEWVLFRPSSPLPNIDDPVPVFDF